MTNTKSKNPLLFISGEVYPPKHGVYFCFVKNTNFKSHRKEAVVFDGLWVKLEDTEIICWLSEGEQEITPYALCETVRDVIFYLKRVGVHYYVSHDADELEIDYLAQLSRSGLQDGVDYANRGKYTQEHIEAAMNAAYQHGLKATGMDGSTKRKIIKQIKG